MPNRASAHRVSSSTRGTGLVPLDRDALIADCDVNATAAFLRIEITQDDQTDDQQADEQIQCVAVHGGVSFVRKMSGPPLCLFDTDHHRYRHGQSAIHRCNLNPDAKPYNWNISFTGGKESLLSGDLGAAVAKGLANSTLCLRRGYMRQAGRLNRDIPR